jgi:hypothetical protein
MAETASRYESFVLLMVHGNEFAGEWFAFPDDTPPVLVECLVQAAQQAFPDTRVVAVICNPGGVSLETPGVSYATRSVWIIPDRFLDPWRNLLRDFPLNEVGNIYEFIENP